LDESFGDVDRMQFETEQERDEYVDKLLAEFDKEDQLITDSDKDNSTQLKDKFNIWCLCHRIQLAVGDLMSDPKFKQMRKVGIDLSSI
jgi:hypothetical protein